MIGGSCALRRPAFFLVLALGIIWAGAAPSKTITLDDSGTTALEPSVNLHWKSTTPPRSGAGNLMVGTTTIRVRINVLPWLKRTARIYLALPAQPPGPIGASWVAQARFLSGQVRSGNRMLIYTGPITSAFLEDVLQFQFTMEGTRIPRTFPVTFHFEMDEG